MIHTHTEPTTIMCIYYISLPSEWREWHYKSGGFDTHLLLLIVTPDGV